MRLAGIKKQACINRKCLLMVPRDEDGERLARKRAKQRTLPPGTGSSLHRMVTGTGTIDSFAGLTLGGSSLALGNLGQVAMSRCSTIDSDASDRGSPVVGGGWSLGGYASSGRASPTTHAGDEARTQALSERCLYNLALVDDDDDAGRALSSAMLFAAIQTPQCSPQRESAHAVRSSQHSPLGKRGGASPRPRHSEPLQPTEVAAAGGCAETAAAAKPEPPLTDASPEIALLKAELGIVDAPEDPAVSEPSKAPASGEAAAPSAAATAAAAALSAVLTPAFTAQIAAKLELDEPPKPPRLDELHEEFLLLNAEHRMCREYAMATEECTAAPVLAF